MSGKRPPATGQTSQVYSRLFAPDIRYLLYLPEDYYQNANQRWPLVLFLHGAGERGTDLNLVTKHGPPKLAAAGERFPFIILSPQCPEDRRWKSGPLKRLLDRVKLNFRVDETRIYLTGLSMGGYGTWHLAARYPEYFAAIAPICGAGDPEHAETLRDVPVWAFHGAQDEVFRLTASSRWLTP
ncbi:MAG TPA: alpha/beta hydrolase-fold protein [bacterium]|nr:alpha/beta hydrolase-fold protein [bacterium]